jgi:hypothetical protein
MNKNEEDGKRERKRREGGGKEWKNKGKSDIPARKSAGESGKQN